MPPAPIGSLGSLCLRAGGAVAFCPLDDLVPGRVSRFSVPGRVSALVLSCCRCLPFFLGLAVRRSLYLLFCSGRCLAAFLRASPPSPGPSGHWGVGALLPLLPSGAWCGRGLSCPPRPLVGRRSCFALGVRPGRVPDCPCGSLPEPTRLPRFAHSGSANWPKIWVTHGHLRWSAHFNY